MSSGSSAECYSAFAVNGLRETLENLNQVTCPNQNLNSATRFTVRRPNHSASSQLVYVSAQEVSMQTESLKRGQETLSLFPDGLSGIGRHNFIATRQKGSLPSKNLKVRIYKTVILRVVLDSTLREEQRLRLFENKVLRKIFRTKRDEVTGEWRELHNTELHALYSPPDIIRNIKSKRLRWAGRVARMGESRNAYRVLVGRPEVKRPLGRLRRRWEGNIKMDLREVGYDDRDWINLAQDRDRWRQ
ncbi:hypothetical protein ANN_08399 [Periplaneta americana]|uniref:Uncharacterized protein n=1 Tax=Periplaneta americana TaxID=6978 RepID=A0ABQ8T1C3_PERAM|nr:hypothetical protein ANN_08399 [Periplaneta americana]